MTITRPDHADCQPRPRPIWTRSLGVENVPRPAFYQEIHMAQNIYDNPDFFSGYSQLPRQVQGLDGAPE